MRTKRQEVCEATAIILICPGLVLMIPGFAFLWLAEKFLYKRYDKPEKEYCCEDECELCQK